VLNRLTSATVGVNIAKTFSYDAIGNIVSKSDVGAYSYPAPGQPFPRAVSSISGGVVNTTFSYDANGNLTSGNGLAITYTACGQARDDHDFAGSHFRNGKPVPTFPENAPAAQTPSASPTIASISASSSWPRRARRSI
jgi:hypothetical protein